MRRMKSFFFVQDCIIYFIGTKQISQKLTVAGSLLEALQWRDWEQSSLVCSWWWIGVGLTLVQLVIVWLCISYQSSRRLSSLLFSSLLFSSSLLLFSLPGACVKASRSQGNGSSPLVVYAPLARLISNKSCKVSPLQRNWQQDNLKRTGICVRVYMRVYIYI